MLVQMLWGSDIPDHKIERDPSRHLEGSQQVQRCNVAKREIIVTIPYSFWWKKSAEQKIFVSLYLSKLLIGTLCEPCNNQLCATYTKNENKKTEILRSSESETQNHYKFTMEGWGGQHCEVKCNNLCILIYEENNLD